jgi:hypothetical protein
MMYKALEKKKSVYDNNMILSAAYRSAPEA